MSASKRPSTSSLRRFITSRPYVPVAELRRRFGLDDPDTMVHLSRNGTSAWIGLPEREAGKIQDLWDREELGVELSVEVRAPVIVGVYPMRIARYVMENGSHGANGWNGNGGQNGHADAEADADADADAEPAATDATDAARAGESARHGPNGGGDGPRGSRRPWHRRRDADRARQHTPRPMNGAPSYGSEEAGEPRG